MFKPADDAPAALGGRLPPRAARHHDHQRRALAIPAAHRQEEVLPLRRCAGAVGDEPRCGAARRSGEYRLARLAGEVDRRRSIGFAEALGVQQSHARLRAGAQDDQPAMRGGAAQPFVFRGVDSARRQLGDADRSTAAERTERSGNAVAVGRGASNTGTAVIRSPPISR
jgi:hypothetical protein